MERDWCMASILNSGTEDDQSTVYGGVRPVAQQGGMQYMRRIGAPHMGGRRCAKTIFKIILIKSLK